MKMGTGNILGGSILELKRTTRSSNCRTTPLSPRAAHYTVNPPATHRSTSEPLAQCFDGQSSANSSSRRIVWCSAMASSPASRPASPSYRANCSRDAGYVTSAFVLPPRARWGWLPAPSPRDSCRRVRGGKVQPVTAAQASASPAAEANMEISYTSRNGKVVTVRKIRTLDELRQVATLRAEAYYAENQSRFVGSLKKKFVEQEVESLQQRTTIMSRQEKPYSECLVAVDSASGAVLACIDMRLPAALNGVHPHGVPLDDPTGCYLLNVVVREDVRGQGLGRGIMQAAMTRAVRVWCAGRLYTHVEADNEVACGLYHSCGFQQHSADTKYEAASKLGQTVLLMAPTDAAPLF